MSIEYYFCEVCGEERAEDLFDNEDFTGPCTICASKIKKGIVIKRKAKEL